jgi:hypothetical protein
MCHMMYYAPGIQVDPDDLRRAAEVNDEGSGWAIAGKAMVWNDRDMDSEEMITEFTHLRNAMLDREAVFHSRLATVGRVTLDQVHPVLYKLPDGREAALFVNGTLDIPTDGIESDAQRLASEYLVSLDLDDPVYAGSIETMAVRCNAKIAILEGQQAHIFNRSQWLVTPYGALASNADHLGKGKGWDEKVIDGELHRWRVRQPGQCHGCDLYGCTTEHLYPALVPPAFRNEAQRRLQRGRRRETVIDLRREK